jgi:hypothetical protein
VNLAATVCNSRFCSETKRPELKDLLGVLPIRTDVNFSSETAYRRLTANALRNGSQGLGLVISATACLGIRSTVHSTPRSASSAIFCKEAALDLSASARASRLSPTARS